MKAKIMKRLRGSLLISEKSDDHISHFWRKPVFEPPTKMFCVHSSMNETYYFKWHLKDKTSKQLLTSKYRHHNLKRNFDRLFKTVPFLSIHPVL